MKMPIVLVLAAMTSASAFADGLVVVPGMPETVERSGNGENDDRWYSGRFGLEPDSAYHLSFEMKSPGGAAAVTGTDDVNVDLDDACGDWTGKEYVFRTGSETSGGRLHFGQWHINGTVAFRNIRLKRVKPVHAQTCGVTLGSGEQIEGGTYRYTSGYLGFFRNDGRSLFSVRKATFNTSRWNMSGGSEIVYRHRVGSRKFKSAVLRVGCCYRERGEVKADVLAADGSWIPVGTLAAVGEAEFAVPGKVFPADEIRVRFTGAEKTYLQINSYSLDAEIDGEAVWACGSTRYVDMKGRDVGGNAPSPYFADDYGEILQQSPSVALWRASSGRKVPPMRNLPVARASALEISTAANEAEATQLVVTPKDGADDVRVVVSGDLVSGGRRIPASAVEVLRVSYVDIALATDAAGCRGRWPDPLPRQDSSPLAVAAGANQPFWVRVKPPKGTPKGVYRTKLEVRMRRGSSRRSLSVPLEVEVFGFDLPDTMTCQTAFGCNMDGPWRYHGAKTAAERAVVTRRYLDALASCHLSPYNPVPGVSWSVRWKNGRPEFDWARWDAAMEEAIDRWHINAFQMGVAGLGSGTFHSRTEPSINGVPATDPSYQAMMGRYLKGIESHLREKGWLDRAFVYWFDEPDKKDYAFVMNGFTTLKRHAPGLRRMLTEHISDELVGGPNIWCPHTAGYDPVKTKERLSAGEEVWWYICCSPKAPYAGEFIDHPSNELRMWLWQTWGEGVSGVLIWETLYWTSKEAYPDRPQNPYRDPMSWVTGYGTKTNARLPWGNGDGRLFYPPAALADGEAEKFTDAEPVASFRSEGLRDGLEDYEYFAILKRLDPDNPLLKVPSEVYRTLTDFSTDPSDIENHRIKLAREIERLMARAPAAGKKSKR